MSDMGCHAAGSIGRESSPDEAAVDKAFAMAGCLARDLVPDSADQASMHLIHSSLQSSIPLFAHLFVYSLILLFTQLLVCSFGIHSSISHSINFHKFTCPFTRACIWLLIQHMTFPVTNSPDMGGQHTSSERS